MEKLLAHLIGHIIGIDRGLRFNAERGHRLENAMKPIVLWRFRIPFWGIPWPQQCQLASFTRGHVVLVSLFPPRPETDCLFVQIIASLIFGVASENEHRARYKQKDQHHSPPYHGAPRRARAQWRTIRRRPCPRWPRAA